MKYNIFFMSRECPSKRPSNIMYNYLICYYIIHSVRVNSILAKSSDLNKMPKSVQGVSE